MVENTHIGILIIFIFFKWQTKLEPISFYIYNLFFSFFCILENQHVHYKTVSQEAHSEKYSVP